MRATNMGNKLQEQTSKYLSAVLPNSKNFYIAFRQWRIYELCSSQLSHCQHGNIARLPASEGTTIKIQEGVIALFQGQFEHD